MIAQAKVIRFIAQVAAGSIGVGLLTFVCFAAHLGFAIPCLLFTLVVVLQSLWGGFGAAAVVSVIAAACLDYFFIPPVLTWQISSPEYGLALVAYWAISLVITRLASKARNEAQIAERRRRDAGLLYEAASRLLALEPQNAAGPESLRIFREVFSLRAVCCLDAGTMQLGIEGTSDCRLEEKTRSAWKLGTDCHSPDNCLFIRCLRTSGNIAGAIGFEGHFGDDSIPLALSVLAANAIERMHSFNRASKAAADAQAEMLRSALLDAFAHEFKTPLAIILSAAGGLREMNVAQSGPDEMTGIIETQALRLNQLTTRLLRTARLDRKNIAPRLELTSLNALVENLVDQYQKFFGRRISADFGSDAAEIMADPELLGLAVNQLLDNARKYSLPGTVVEVRLNVEDGNAHVSVANEGTAIRPAERERIFERFFRGSETKMVTPGAGLGLYVARMIVGAHGGHLELDREIPSSSNTTFRISLPLIHHEQRENKACQSAGSRR